MMELAWSGYKKFAWGQNELKPIARSGHSPGIFGRAANLGATIVDSLDTLYIMGLMDEFNDAKDWIIKNLNLNIVRKRKF
jgi:mannosyl-oligosaccharide alpha-1,2-mannosidase